MNKFFLRLALASVAILPAASAMAADLDVMPPPPPVEELRPATYDWTGAYVGAWVGETCIEGTLIEHAAGGDVLWENSGCGHKGGVMAGYNHQFDNFVLGLEADWGMTGSIAENTEAGGDFAFKMDHLVTGRVRAGYAWDDTLFYYTGGLAWAKGDLDGIIAADPNHIKGSHFGVSMGGGVEHAFTDQLRLRLEYIYTKFGKDNYYSTSCAATCDVDIPKFDDHEIKVGLIWAF
jgi:outer membrane immunogenic protein